MSSPSVILDWRGVPASEIAPGHWQSGLPMPFVELPDQGVDLVVLSAKEVQPGPSEIEHVRRACPRLKLITAPLQDTEDEDELVRILLVADQVATRVVQRLAEGKTVLVTCQVGRNRSGLISALVLMKRFDVSGKEAAERVRIARRAHLPPDEEALSNNTFRSYLESLPKSEGWL